jgi:hypothetical protein
VTNSKDNEEKLKYIKILEENGVFFEENVWQTFTVTQLRNYVKKIPTRKK